MKKKKGPEKGSLVTNKRLKEKVLLSALLEKLSNEHEVYRKTDENDTCYIVTNIAPRDTVLLPENDSEWFTPDGFENIMVVVEEDMHL